ncbi:MAG: hypothetical protein ACRCV9_10125 [Burkholderiaceae bacterium]
MFKQASFVAQAPPRVPAPSPALAAAARKVAGVLIGYARAQRKQARAQAAPRIPVREFGTVVLGGQLLGAIYEDGQLIAVIPDVERM